jgi:hypothetical protein
MRGLLQPDAAAILAAALDVTAPTEAVEVRLNETGTTLWVNVGGVCLLRVCRAKVFVKQGWAAE